MNKCTTPTCTVKAVRQGPWFLLEALAVEIPEGLRRGAHAEFRFDRDFAGLSPRGIPLSVKQSQGPATIGELRILENKPEGWHALPHFADSGLPVRTDKPRLAFFGIRKGKWGKRCTSLCIHPDDLSPIVKIPAPASQPQPNDLRIHNLSSSLVNLLAQRAEKLNVVLFEDGTYVRVPESLRLNSSEWTHLKRYLFTGHTSGTLGDTTIFGKGVDALKLPGDTIDEVKMKWGVGGLKPSAYDGKYLYVNSLDVLPGSKLSDLFPNAERLEGRRLEVVPPPRFVSRESSLGLGEALDAGIVPAQGILRVDPDLSRIYLRAENLQINKFRCPIVAPLGYGEEPAVLCPEHLVAKFLMPARIAVRTYVVPTEIQRFRIRTQAVDSYSEEDPPGTYYRLRDLQNLAQRDLKCEIAERRAREQRLVARYGSALPAGHEKLTDEQIAVYFEIQDLVQQGELIRADDHPLLPPDYHAREMLSWIQAEAPHLTATCPVTRHVYVRRLDGFEDLVDIPGFWRAVESTLGVGDWLRRLLICPRVQAAALISTI